MVSDLLHLIFRQQLSPGATVTGLRARLALLPVLLQQFLRFLPRLRSTLLTSLRHIRRRRRGTVARTRGGFLLQPPQPPLQTQPPIHHTHQELNARLPTRVIDRLSLRPLHTDKVRRPPERTLLWKARRTERLRQAAKPRRGLARPQGEFGCFALSFAVIAVLCYCYPAWDARVALDRVSEAVPKRNPTFGIRRTDPHRRTTPRSKNDAVAAALTDASHHWIRMLGQITRRWSLGKGACRSGRNRAVL